MYFTGRARAATRRGMTVVTLRVDERKARTSLSGHRIEHLLVNNKRQESLTDG